MVSKTQVLLASLSLLCLSTMAVASEVLVSANAEQNSAQLEAVLAVDGNAEFGAYLAGECLTCHTPAVQNGNIPLIHGKDKRYLASALLEYKNKQRDNDVMRGVTAALTVDEIAALVTYLSDQ